MSRIFTTSTFARRLGFRDARDKKFRQLLKLAEKKGLIKIQQSGFKADSMHHPKIVVLMKPFEEVKFVERTVFPSYVPFTEVDGYKLVWKFPDVRGYHSCSLPFDFDFLKEFFKE